MKKMLDQITLVLFISFPILLYASAPKDLMIDKHPIDALCFFNMEGNSRNIDLKNCGLSKYKYTRKGNNALLAKKGFIGYNWEDPSASYKAQGYSYYKIFNAGHRQYWIYTVNNGGGSGEFTSIQLVKRKNAHMVDTKVISDGDRCNGGIQNVSATNNQLTFSNNLTAYDFITLAKNHETSISAYNDLANCAVCCVAKAFYTVASNTKPQLQYISLSSIKNTQEIPRKGKRQACFNKLLSSYALTGNNQFKQNRLTQFVDKFNKTCEQN